MRLLNNIIIQSENFLTNFELQIVGSQKLVPEEERNRDRSLVLLMAPIGKKADQENRPHGHAWSCTVLD